MKRALETENPKRQRIRSAISELNYRSRDMGAKEVYESLQEIFPQIDARVLWAVAFEHSNDRDEAVVTVLEEIIPFLGERYTPSNPFTSSISVGESSQGAVVRTQTEDCQNVNIANSAEVQNAYNVNNGNQHADDGHNEPFYDADDGNKGGFDFTVDLTYSETNIEDRINTSAFMSSQSEPVVETDGSGVNSRQIEVSGDHETDVTISDNQCTENIFKISSNVGMSGNVENDLEKSRMDGNNPEKSVVTINPLENSVHLVENGSNGEKLEESLSTDTTSKPETLSNIIGTENESSLSPIISPHTQINVVDVIEEIIADARNNKKNMFLKMDSVISLMKQVEHKEKAAETAKVEAAQGGIDILDKVEELERMLQHAKKANEMHAAEVNGEKAILSTELGELQSRLLSLSDEREKSLAILDEIRQTLEVRLVAAENEIKSVEQEKVEKEKTARKSLADQELIMEKVVEESKILKKQAEDNAKLQEFLVDRGREVDMLHGEIAVICQDVKLLKEGVENRVPFSKSLFSNQTSFALASSSHSLLKDPVESRAVADDFSGTQKKREEHERFCKLQSDRMDCKAHVDEGWEIFDNREVDA